MPGIGVVMLGYIAERSDLTAIKIGMEYEKYSILTCAFLATSFMDTVYQAAMARGGFCGCPDRGSMPGFVPCRQRPDGWELGR
jgi:hypothetical protein